MKVVIEAHNSPNVFQFPQITGVELRIYANVPFMTYNGQSIPAGSPNTPNSWFLPVPCDIQGGNIIYIPSHEIDSTEDSPTDRSATYTAWLFANGERLGNVPYLAGYGIPALLDPLTLLAANQTWASLILHRDSRNPPPRQGVYDIGQVEYLITQGLAELRMGSETQVGNVALTIDPVDPGFPIAVGDNDPRLSGGGGSVVDASEAVKGITKLSVAALIPANPVAVGDNDPRMATLEEKAALAGTVGVPDDTNRYVTDDDTRSRIAPIGSIDVAGAGIISPSAASFLFDVVKLTGVLTADRTVNWPISGNRQTIIFWNATSGAFNLHVKTPTEATGVPVSQGAQAILINDGINVIDVTAAVSRVPFYVLEFLGDPARPQSVSCGNMWDGNCADLGPFFWEAWQKMGSGGGSGHYLISEGYGGNHAILFDGSGGNVYDGTGSTSFGADAGPYVGQWAYVAVGWADGLIVVYYDGVPVGKMAFAGPRRASTSGGADLFIGGSDHNEFIGRIAQMRGFEGANPMRGGLNLISFRPSTVFGPQWGVGPANPQANYLAQFYIPQQIIQDLSQGYPPGRNHPGRIRGTGYGFGNFYTVDHSNYPAPQFVIDSGAPNALGLVAPTQPAGKVYTPPGAPVGALIYDSFERKNSTFAFDGIGGIGSTESGSLGPKVWNDRLISGITEHSFGILNERAVLLGNENNSRAWVDPGQANVDISVDRVTTRTWQMGDTTAILFRFVDDSNFWFLLGAPNGATEACYLGKVVANALTYVDLGGPAAFNWTTLRVVTKPDGTLRTYLDASNIFTGADATGASVQKCGLFALNQSGGSGLAYRWKNFTVKAS